MKETDFPALYRSADDLSLRSQKQFYFALKVHLGLLVVAAIFSLVPIRHSSAAVLQALTLFGALSCSIFLFSMRPDRLWYTGRALAESIKTITWRYVMRAEPFQQDDNLANSEFHKRVKQILDQNQHVARALTEHLDEPQITQTMSQMRSAPVTERKATYASCRIKDQLAWYKKKSRFNRTKSKMFFWMLIVTNLIAMLCAILRIVFVNVSIWPTDFFIAIAASLLSWMQAKRYSELAASYALAALEIGLIHEQAMLPKSDDELSKFVGDAENAFSREHTQWVARQDV